MTDRFVPFALPALFRIIMDQLKAGHYMGIPRDVFYIPLNNKPEIQRFGQTLGTPIGPAAGPHTQLAQNIVGAWLCGARYIELKTVQTLDELEVSKPCIDMQDEGYNCEWSQELRIHQSFEQYLDAWIIIHLLAEYLKWDGAAGKTIFNMSVGYNMDGILKENIQWFFNKMNNCHEELTTKIDELSKFYPWVKSVHIPHRISNNITLSTMHGCPPDEIEKIGNYLIKEKGLHTIIKLNPTLLGAEKVRYILNEKLGYKTPVPNQAFDHDLKYSEAVSIIQNLTKTATTKGVFFGLKLTNTLESNNFRNIFSEDQKQMYMSGKALHPLAINLAAKIREDFPDIDISFSAGADCFNIEDILACNLSPVTVSTDLLKPGGYGRLSQYLCHLDMLLYHNGISMQQLMTRNPAEKLHEYSQKTLENPSYKKALREPNIKTLRPLNFFDCIHAPCMTTCPGDQNIPLYMHHVANQNWQKAFEVIMQTNPFPNITGKACDHDCQSKCTRINYDSTIAIREIKHYVAGFDHDESFIQSRPSNGMKAAVIGAGPAGLSCAWYLKLAGFDVDVYEEKNAAGGMVQQIIPDFRMTEAEIESDISRIISKGVNIHFNTRMTTELFEKLQQSDAFIFVGIGATSSHKPGIPGEESIDVMDPLKFLSEYKSNPWKKTDAKNILIIGGGNTAIDVARTARRFADTHASVSIVYRRTLQDMPASEEEILAAMNEGITIKELLSPTQIITENGRVTGLQCVRMKIAGHEPSGRQKVQPMKGTHLTLETDMIIPAVGQHTAWDFVSKELMKPLNEGFLTGLERVYIGGDARAGASNIISAIADGRKAAEAIIKKAGIEFTENLPQEKEKATVKDLMISKANRILSNKTTANGKTTKISSPAAARAEAERCLLCDEICNICISVCPNFANQSYKTNPTTYKLQSASQDKDGVVTLMEGPEFGITQKYQIYNIADFCNECGNCRTFCPTLGAPYQDKPKIHISDESWNAAQEGFRLNHWGTEKGIEYKDKQNNLYLLYINCRNGVITFKTPDATAQLHSDTLRIKSIRFVREGEKTVSMETAAIMHSILKGVQI
jgi:putative selenate reductase